MVFTTVLFFFNADVILFFSAIVILYAGWEWGQFSWPPIFLHKVFILLIYVSNNSLIKFFDGR